MPPAMLAPAPAAALAMARPIRPCTPNMPMLVMLRFMGEPRARRKRNSAGRGRVWAGIQGRGEIKWLNMKKK
jgi:hypothetical protein